MIDEFQIIAEVDKKYKPESNHGCDYKPEKDNQYLNGYDKMCECLCGKGA